MNRTIIAALAVWIACAVSTPADEAGVASASKVELDTLVAQIQQKLRDGEKSAGQLAPEVAAFEVLRAKYADASPAAAAKIMQMQYSFLRDIVKDSVRATEVKTLLATKYRKQIEGTRIAQQIAGEEKSERMKETQKALIGKPAPELTFAWASDSKLEKLSDLKGKVVVLDFWATWCGPCLATFPELRELSAHYKSDDVVVLGVTSLQGYVSNLKPSRVNTRENPDNEYALTAEFIKARNMTWPVVFTHQRVFNEEYGVSFIPHLAIVAPDGTMRHAYVDSSLPSAKKRALIDEVLQEFGKKPATE